MAGGNTKTRFFFCIIYVFYALKLAIINTLLTVNVHVIN